MEEVLLEKDGRMRPRSQVTVVRGPISDRIGEILERVPEGYLVERIVVREYEVYLVRDMTMNLKGSRTKKQVRAPVRTAAKKK